MVRWCIIIIILFLLKERIVKEIFPNMKEIVQMIIQETIINLPLLDGIMIGGSHND